MRSVFGFCFLLILFTACKKDHTQKEASCDMQAIYEKNAAKVTITKGIWGTVSSLEGNCMPINGPGSSSCTHCPAQRTVKIYAYTTLSNAVSAGIAPYFFNSFNTKLIASIETDEDGFYQADIPVGKYSVVIVEEGKLYVLSIDGDGINPVNFNGGIQRQNLVMTYKAAF